MQKIYATSLYDTGRFYKRKKNLTLPPSIMRIRCTNIQERKRPQRAKKDWHNFNPSWRKERSSFFLICLLSVFLTSCGYHLGRGEFCQGYRTVCVPFVEGDRDGLFTNALIRAFTTSGCLTYGGTAADLV